MDYGIWGSDAVWAVALIVILAVSFLWFASRERDEFAGFKGGERKDEREEIEDDRI